MCRQVSRLGFLLLGRLPIPPPGNSGLLSVRPLHGYWDSSEISSAFPRRCAEQHRRSFTHQHTLFISKHASPPVRRHDNTFRLAKSPPFVVFRGRSP